ncbi:hypothetical protein F4808DRAFT_118882 [Astrocystis sublimbata]|nr:hypothetical protein F4808DRAFT_118882 [Astrocystis sublimbata]
MHSVPRSISITVFFFFFLADAAIGRQWSYISMVSTGCSIHQVVVEVYHRPRPSTYPRHSSKPNRVQQRRRRRFILVEIHDYDMT